MSKALEQAAERAKALGQTLRIVQTVDTEDETEEEGS